MDEDIIRAAVYHYARKYLLEPEPCLEPHTVAGACVSTTQIRVLGWPPDVTAYRLIVEEPDAGWSGEINVGLRADQPWRMRVVQTWDDAGTHGGPAGAHGAMIEWLQSL